MEQQVGIHRAKLTQGVSQVPTMEVQIIWNVRCDVACKRNAAPTVLTCEHAGLKRIIWIELDPSTEGEPENQEQDSIRKGNLREEVLNHATANQHNSKTVQWKLVIVMACVVVTDS